MKLVIGTVRGAARARRRHPSAPIRLGGAVGVRCVREVELVDAEEVARELAEEFGLELGEPGELKVSELDRWVNDNNIADTFAYSFTRKK